MAINLSRKHKATTVRTTSPLVLASASPRRLQIMHDLGLEFDVVPADIDEDALVGVDPVMLAKSLASHKAKAVSAVMPDACVVAADTVVEFDGASIGKPSGNAEAVAMLQSLSGKTHLVHTGVAVERRGASVSGVETTRVKMRDLSASEIAAYVESGAPLDKAGAYGIQDENFSPVESYDGSYLNVVGLPIGLLARLLTEAGEIDGVTAAEIGREDAQ